MKNIGDFTSKLDVLKNLGSSGADSFYNISNSLKDLTANAAVDKLNKLKLNPQLSNDILEEANNAKILKSSTDEVTQAMSNLGSTGAQGTSALSSGLSGLSQIFQGFIPSPLGLAAVVAGGTMAVMAVIDHFTTNYSEALQNAQTVAQNYANTKSDLSALNNEYQTNLERIQQLQALKNSGTITASEISELSNLFSQNQVLEPQITAKEKLLEIDQQEVNKTAAASL